MTRARIVIQGTVQGVGFRPFVHALARRLDLGGWVRNDCGGVTVEVSGTDDAVARFRRDLVEEAPPLAHIDRVRVDLLPPRDLPRFRITESRNGGSRVAAVTPDAALCPACRAELDDPRDRRHRYPFLNCTHCGPRYSIQRDVPYDRPLTAMAGFAMCAACRGEYEDPSDRRFHAQPTACPECGPRLWAADASGAALSGDPIARAAQFLREGRIVAVKGLGGFHLAVDAGNDAAVQELRRRKHREAKPLAVMVRDRETACRVAAVDDAAWALLTSPESPVVLLPRLEGSPLAPGVAPDTNTVGLLLPYTPLHHLLLGEPGCELLVMTSGNRTDEPICVENDDARERLGGLADLFLLHDRPIAARCDDSVLRLDPGGPTILRRSRGYVPRGIPLPFAPPPVLAVGALLKNTFCITRGSEAFLGPHIGDLDDERAQEFFQEAEAHLERLLGVHPTIVAHDLHPNYPSTILAGEREGVLEPVQHHHAHVAACLVENGETGPAVGLALDGFGLGEDGQAWGGEILVAGLADYERVGHLLSVPLPGGDRAAREPWRMALAHLETALGEELPGELPVLRRRSPEEIRVLLKILRSTSLCPTTTSAGRLFDAVAALCDLGDRVSYEGQAAMRLETLAGPPDLENVLLPYPLPVEQGPEGLLLDTRPLICAVVSDLRNGVARQNVARRFHRGLAAGFAKGAVQAAHARSLDTVALSGGCFQNRFLLVETGERLQSAGLRVLRHRRVPPNDGGLSLGQAAVAGARAAGARS